MRWISLLPWLQSSCLVLVWSESRSRLLCASALFSPTAWKTRYHSTISTSFLTLFSLSLPFYRLFFLSLLSLSINLYLFFILPFLLSFTHSHIYTLTVAVRVRRLPSTNGWGESLLRASAPSWRAHRLCQRTDPASHQKCLRSQFCHFVALIDWSARKKREKKRESEWVSEKIDQFQFQEADRTLAKKY